jgi:hypothetical protein
MTKDTFRCRNQNPVDSLFMTCHRMVFTKFAQHMPLLKQVPLTPGVSLPDFCADHVAQSFVICVVFCGSRFILIRKKKCEGGRFSFRCCIYVFVCVTASEHPLWYLQTSFQVVKICIKHI